MTASLFGGGSSINVSASGTLVPQTFIATAGQTVFNITSFTYTQNTNSLLVFINGSKQRSGVDFTETTTSSFTLAEGAVVGDVVEIIGFPLSSIQFLNTAANVPYTPAGTGAVATTVQAKLRESVSVFDFMTAAQIADVQARTLTQNVRSAVQAAFNASKRVSFPSGSYWMGTYSTGDKIIDLSSLGDGVSIITDGSVELVCQTTANVIPSFFYLFGNSHFSCGLIKFRDLGYDSAITWKGACGFLLDNNITAAGNWGDLIFDGIYGKNLVQVMAIVGGDATHRIRGIRVGQLFSDDCYYGLNAQNQGDGVVIDNLIAYQNYRPYFVYGVTDHKVKIFNRNNRGGSGAVNISRNPGGLNTKGIDVSYVARDQTQGITHVLINHIDLLGGEISDIRLNIDIESSVVYTPIRFVNYTGSGGSETSAASLNQVYDITVAGSCDIQASTISATASYANKRRLNFVPGLNFNYGTSIPALFYLNAAARPSTIVWTASVTSPVLGNGSIANNVDVINGIVYNNVALTAGSTTTFGSGEWSFGLPYTATVAAVGIAWILDNGTLYYIGVAKIEAGSSSAQVFINGAASAINSGSPMTWATGDRLIFTLSYPIS